VIDELTESATDKNELKIFMIGWEPIEFGSEDD